MGISIVSRMFLCDCNGSVVFSPRGIQVWSCSVDVVRGVFGDLIADRPQLAEAPRRHSF